MSDEGTDETNDEERVARLAAINRMFAEAVPLNRALGLELVELADGLARMRLPWRAELVGNPETGVLHGGAITTLMDACCGAAVFMKQRKPVPIATLDLRIDYLKPAASHRVVHARAVCFKVTHNVAFVRGVAYHLEDGSEDTDDCRDLIASAAGAFMLGTKVGASKSWRGKQRERQEDRDPS